jgi:MoaA/NifB/PqqE/SkfB family radical SAM enzyme
LENKIRRIRIVKNIICYLFGKKSISLEEADKIADTSYPLMRNVPERVFQIAIKTYALIRKAKPQKAKSIGLTGRRFGNSSRTLFHLLKTYDPRVPFYLARAQLINQGRVKGFGPVGPRVRLKRAQELGVVVPWVLVINVTTRCNMNPFCRGCYAAMFPKIDDPSVKEIDRLIDEVVELGTSVVVFSGGEPLLRELDLVEVIRKHPQLSFAIFTNGTLITEETPRRFLASGAPVMFFVSLEGFKETTDRRRNPGTFEKVVDSINVLRRAKFPFAFSVTATRENYSEAMSEEFIDFLKSQECLAALYFVYKPVGLNPQDDLRLTDEQKQQMREAIERFRREGMLIFSPEDFLAKERIGCIAGEGYVSVTARGELQPCVFIHAADPEIKLFGEGRQTFSEALTSSSLIRACQSAQSDSRCCLIEERPNVLRQILEETKAISTEQKAVR